MSSESRYLLQIINRDSGEVASSWEPGSRVEADVIKQVVDRMHAKGVGWFKSKDTVETAVRASWDELLADLKSTVVPNAR